MIRGHHTTAGRGRTGFRRRAVAGLAAFAAAAAVAAGLGSPAPAARAQGTPLDVTEVKDLVSRSLHFARRVAGRPDITVGVVDTEGNALGVFHAAGVPADPTERARRAARALAKAGTGAYFSSDDESFTTRTAAFIIQNHFPPGVRFTPGGPLYGVEFSSIGTTDVNPICLPVPAAGFEARVRGDLGGVGLYRGRGRIGGLGIDDGETSRQLSIPDRILFGGGCAADYTITFPNLERGRQIERIAVAAARPYLAPAGIRATEVTVDGFRLPFSRPAGLAERIVAPYVDGVDGSFDPAYPLRSAEGIPSRFSAFTLDPPPGAGAGARSFRGEVPVAFPIRAGTDGILSEDDVRRMLWQGANRAWSTRGAIRRPVGKMMQCWIAVTDTRGEVLGVFRFVEDATLFSYDVAVQKARTAAFFSDDDVAWSSRGVGLFSQGFYPPGQQGDYVGPLFQLQDGITVGLLTGGIPSAPAAAFPVRNGITVFPGGVPVYKGGRLAGGVGVSGDGIDQDDIVADTASQGFDAPGRIRCDAQDGAALRRSLRRALDRLGTLVAPDPGTCDVADGVDKVGLSFFHARLRDVRRRIENTPFTVGPSYVKYPRHPGPVTIR